MQIEIRTYILQVFGYFSANFPKENDFCFLRRRLSSIMYIVSVESPSEYIRDLFISCADSLMG